jgi:hypothetical protein
LGSQLQPFGSKLQAYASTHSLDALPGTTQTNFTLIQPSSEEIDEAEHIANLYAGKPHAIGARLEAEYRARKHEAELLARAAKKAGGDRHGV